MLHTAIVLKMWTFPLISRLNLGVGDAFVDDSFPPSGRSLYYNRECPSLEPELARDRQSVSQWLRPGQIVAEGDQKIKWTVFRTPLPSDISQGILGNCWLLSALAVLTEREDLVRKILGKSEVIHGNERKREAIKKRINKDIGLKGGRGSIWKPKFYIVRNKDILAWREGVKDTKSNFFPQL